MPFGCFYFCTWKSRALDTQSCVWGIMCILSVWMCLWTHRYRSTTNASLYIGLSLFRRICDLPGLSLSDALQTNDNRNAESSHMIYGWDPLRMCGSINQARTSVCLFLSVRQHQHGQWIMQTTGHVNNLTVHCTRFNSANNVMPAFRLVLESIASFAYTMWLKYLVHNDNKDILLSTSQEMFKFILSWFNKSKIQRRILNARTIAAC